VKFEHTNSTFHSGCSYKMFRLGYT
jgi:hypothetical protein